MHYKWETIYSHPMNIKLNVIALAVFAAVLFLSGTGAFSLYDPIYAQVNILPGTDESTNTTSGDGGVGSSTPPTAGLQFNAQDIAQTNSLKLDSDVKNLVILIPDKRLITQSFLPLDATIVEGTKVIWSNGDKGSPHGISLQDSDMQVLLSNETIPYQNGTEYTFDTQGTYTFSDPLNTDPSAPKGTINVIAPQNAPDNLSTNSTQATAGLFVVQAEDKDYFDKHFNTLGYHVEGSYMIPGPGGNDIEVYVYTQKSGKYPTIIDRTAVKEQFTDAQIEEG
jgi:plastocyanin